MIFFLKILKFILCVFVCLHVHWFACRGHSLTSGVFPNYSPPYLLRQDVSLTLDSSALAVLQAPGILLPLPFLHMPLCTASLGAGVWTLVLVLVQALYPEPSPQPQHIQFLCAQESPARICHILRQKTDFIIVKEWNLQSVFWHKYIYLLKSPPSKYLI